MFEYGGQPKTRDPFWGFYVVQLVLAYPIIGIATAPFAALFSILGLSGQNPSHVSFAGYDALLCLFIGALVGAAIGYTFPSLQPSGRWIWLLPTIFAVPVMILYFLKSQPVPQLPPSLFFTDEGLDPVLLTLPACANTGYSIGMVLLAPLRRWVTHGPSATRRIALLTLGCTGLLLASAGLLHVLEERYATAANKVRTVIEPHGLPFSPDPDLLCISPSPANLPVLKAPVETIETRTCSEGHLLRPGETKSRNAYDIEHVKILVGPVAGREGWVPSYGLRHTEH